MMKPKNVLCHLMTGFCILFSPGLFAEELCQRLESIWNQVTSYQCSYHSTTYYEKKKAETRMHYRYQKPGKIRMDIHVPNSGAVLIYNAEHSKEVRVRPHSRLPFLVFSYALNHPKVISDSGGTVDQSHLGERVKSFCMDLAALSVAERQEITALFNGKKELRFKLPHQKDGRTITRRWTFGADLLPRRIESLGNDGVVLEIFEWNNLILNPGLDMEIFKAF